MKSSERTAPQLYIQVIKLVIRNIMANKRRNILTCLGIIIGIAAFLCLSAVNNISEEQAQGMVKSYGFNNFMFTLEDMTMRPRGWTDDDVEYFSSLNEVTCVDRYIDYSNNISLLENGIKIQNVFLSGRSGAYYKNVYDNGLKKGRLITDHDNETKSRVCIVDEEIEDQLFGGEDCLGKQITIMGIKYEIIGVDRHSNNTVDRLFSSYNVIPHVTVPAETLSDQLGLAYNSVLFFMNTQDSAVISNTHEKALEYIDDRLHLNPYDGGFMDDYFADQMEEQMMEAQQNNKVKRIVSLICLLVGGIGIMNMMLVSVAERTREIGLRKALGATEKRIQMQFLMESVILSLAGGLVGVAIGLVFTAGADVVASIAMSSIFHKTLIVTYVDWGGLAFSFLASIFVGVVFGVIPARKASKLNPIEALRL